MKGGAFKGRQIHYYLVLLKLLLTEECEAWGGAILIGGSSFLSVTEVYPPPPHSCHFFLSPNRCSVISDRTDVKKISRSHIGAFIEILCLYISRSQL